MIYADSSVLVAWFHPDDLFARDVTAWVQGEGIDFVWNVFLRAEVRHNLRRLKGAYAGTAWNAYRAAEDGRKLRMEKRPPGDILTRADELSERHAAATTAGTWDFVHLAAALSAKADVFATADEPQAKAAKLAGLRVKLFKS